MFYFKIKMKWFETDTQQVYVGKIFIIFKINIFVNFLFSIFLFFFFIDFILVNFMSFILGCFDVAISV